MVADALVYHPSVAHYLRFVATTGKLLLLRPPITTDLQQRSSASSPVSSALLLYLGRDKLLRTLQYFARFYSWYLLRTNAPTRLIQPWDAVKKNFALTRKALRIGKNVEHFKAAATAADSRGMDIVLKYCAVGRQLGYAMYLSCDMITYIDAAGIKSLSSAKRLQKEAYRAWFMGLSFNAIAGIYTLWRLRQRELSLDKKEGEGVVESKKLQRERTSTNIQLISDLCDMTVPGSALGWANFDDGFVGLAGTVSSLIGVWSQWKKTA
ncbi:Peroxisomal membrane protein PMP27 [Agyrium rufum]|nr:Peroxisomal membrane protein PMP27 [Agyrium rufum]